MLGLGLLLRPSLRVKMFLGLCLGLMNSKAGSGPGTHIPDIYSHPNSHVASLVGGVVSRILF